MKPEYFLFSTIIAIQAVVYVSALQIGGKAVDYAQFIFLGIALAIVVGPYMLYRWRRKKNRME